MWRIPYQAIKQVLRRLEQAANFFARQTERPLSLLIQIRSRREKNNGGLLPAALQHLNADLRQLDYVLVMPGHEKSALFVRPGVEHRIATGSHAIVILLLYRSPLSSAEQRANDETIIPSFL